MNVTFLTPPTPLAKGYEDRVVIARGVTSNGISFFAIIDKIDIATAFKLLFITCKPDKSLIDCYFNPECYILKYKANWYNKRFNDDIYVHQDKFKRLGFGRLSYQLLVRWYGPLLVTKFNRGGVYFDRGSDNYECIMKHYLQGTDMLDAVKYSFTAKMWREYLHLVPELVNKETLIIAVEFIK